MPCNKNCARTRFRSQSPVPQRRDLPFGSQKLLPNAELFLVPDVAHVRAPRARLRS
jgi:hypothetical protein